MAQASVGLLQRLIGRGAVRSSPLADLQFGEFIDRVSRSLRSSRLTLIVGAGLSYESGFPTWTGLLGRLAEELVAPEQRAAVEQLSAYDSPLIIARYLKSRLAVEGVLHKLVRDALYAPTVDYHARNPTLRFVLAVIEMAAAIGSRLDIVTYNFDSLLEEKLAEVLPHIAIESISTDLQFFRSTGAIRILHVHGFLDRDSDAQPVLPPPPLILSEDDFHDLMSNPAAWQNQIQGAAFGFKDCLFVGMSMTDPNLRRVLDLAQRNAKRTSDISRLVVARRFAAGDRLAPDAPEMDTPTAEVINAIKADIFRSLAAEPLYVADFADYEALADRVRQAFA